MNKKNTHSPKEGTVLFLAMAIILALGAIAFTTYSFMLTEVTINGNQVNVTRALYDADAGLKYTKRAVETQLESGASLSSILTNLVVQPPPGFNFDAVSAFEVLVPERLFSVSVTGRAGHATTTIEASLRRDSFMDLGVFGDDLVYLSPNTEVYAYDSRIAANPSSASVPGQASLGGNGVVEFKNHARLDGSVSLGASGGGFPASCLGCGGMTSVQIDRIDPDPLGLVGGYLANEMAGLATVNDNARSAAIAGGVLSLRPNQSTTLTAGSYYLSSISLGARSTLNIDASAGPVKLFVTGSIQMQPNAEVNNGGSPMDFQIFNNGTSEVRIQPRNDFTGMIYAPRADLVAQPNGNLNGMLWGKTVTMRPGGRMYVDVALLDQILTNKLTINHWKEVRAN